MLELETSSRVVGAGVQNSESWVKKKIREGSTLLP